MNTLIKFSNFITAISASNSRLYKEAVLKEYSNDSDIKYLLNFLLNPYITTGISDKKFLKMELMPNREILIPDASLFNLLDYIKTYNTGADNYLETVANYYHRHELNTSFLLPTFRGLITKNLPLGIDAKTVNKVIPGLIPTFNVQLANKYFDNPKIVEGKRFALTTKIDGGRIIAIKKNGTAKFYTRQGQEYEGLVDLKEEMERYMPDNICLDGEITLLNPYIPAFDFIAGVDGTKKLSSKEQYKETMKITRKDGEKHGVKMLVFDYMTADEFEAQICDKPYGQRRQMLQAIWGKHYVKYRAFQCGGQDKIVSMQLGAIDESIMKTAFNFFEILPLLYLGDDTSEILKLLDTNIKAGEEGIMINILDAPYEFKRTNNLLKVKKMNDLDLEVVGFEEGSNRHSGRLGALLVDYKGNIVKVGSGFSDELRDEIWTHRDEWLGRTIVVQYFEETTNDQGGISLRFPVYLDYRTDK